MGHEEQRAKELGIQKGAEHKRNDAVDHKRTLG
jgi:hypothetical protein